MEFFKNCSESSDSSRKLKISKSIFSHTKWVKTLVKISEIEFFKKCSKWSDLARKLEILMCKFKLLGQYSDPWGGVISKYRPIFEKFWSNTYRRPKAGGMYWLDQNFEKRGLYLLITPSQGSLYSHCNIPRWFSYLSNLI